MHFHKHYAAESCLLYCMLHNVSTAYKTTTSNKKITESFLKAVAGDREDQELRKPKGAMVVSKPVNSGEVLCYSPR